MPAQITLPIVGVEFPNKSGPTRRFVIELHAPGDAVVLRQEPKNPADPNAIAVDSVNGDQMGYLPAERAPYVGQQIGRGEVSAIFQGRGPRQAFVRIAFDGDEPELPEPRPTPATQSSEAEPEQDWWPDPEWPD